MEMLINSVRKVDYDQAREFAFGDEDSLKENLAIGIMNPEDFKKLNLTPSLNLKVLSKYGEIVIKVKEDENIPQGIIIMPVSIWANQITGVENNELIFKNIKVSVEPTKEQVLEFKDLITKIKGNL